MQSLIIKILIEEIVAAISKAVTSWNLARKNKEKVKEIVSEEDPKLRAIRMRDFLSK